MAILIVADFLETLMVIGNSTKTELRVTIQLNAANGRNHLTVTIEEEDYEAMQSA